MILSHIRFAGAVLVLILLLTAGSSSWAVGNDAEGPLFVGSPPDNSSWHGFGFNATVLRDFWTEVGARLPTREFVAAVQAAAITATDGRGRQRRLVVLSIASEFSFRGKGMWRMFLNNLRNITFTRRDGSQDDLARHLVANVMALPGDTADSCRELSETFGTRCVTITSPIFNRESYGYRTPAFYGISFAKILTILDALSLGVDAFFLDSDQLFFRNPLPYILARDIDVLVTGDCGQRDDMKPAARFPKIASNIGLMYLRSTPMVTRAIADWLYYLSRRAAEGRFLLDQSTFVGAMERISSKVGAQHMSVGMLVADFFPHRCMAPCGCNTVGLPPGAKGRKVYRIPGANCDPNLVRNWYHFHVPCSGDMNDKATSLQKVLRLYTVAVGPVNSLSEPLDAM